jgi:serine/threonine-protein kinase
VETRFRDPKVARVHRELEVVDDRVVLRDAATAAGTFVNGQRITEHVLRPSDVIRIGNTEMRFLCDDTAKDLPVTAATLMPEDAQPNAGHRPPTLVGQTVGHYLLEFVLGSGCWGQVYRARDTRAGAVVAVKVLPEEFGSDRDRLERFAGALRAVLRTRHPHLVTHFGAGKAGPFCWIAQEYVEGRSLTQVIRRIATSGLLDWRYAFRVALQLAQALHAVHAAGMVHGFVSPQNVLIRDSDRVCKLGDLLLARSLWGTACPPRSRPQDRVGDIPYMSPERTQDLAGVDARSDLYSLGASVYAVLTGRPPFVGESWTGTLSMVHQTEPTAPRSRHPSIPAPFDSAVLKLLAKRPGDRFQSAAELLATLEHIGRWSLQIP